MKSIREILDQSVSGGAISSQNITGSILRAHTISPYACYCEYHVDPRAKDAPTNFGNLLQTWGIELEHRYVDSKDQAARKQCFSYDPAGFETFVNAAANSQKYIYNPPLFWLKDNLAGKPDLLVRGDTAPSNFGRHHYRVVEIKFSSRFAEKNKRHYLIQALLYNHMLGLIQGYLPPLFTMVNRHGEESIFEYTQYEEELKQALREVEEIRVGTVKPDPVYGTCADAHWAKYCDAQAKAKKDISLVPYLKDQRIRSQMVATGIRTIDDLSKLSVDELSKFKWVGKRSELIFKQTKCLLTGKEFVCDKLVLPAYDGPEVYLDVEDTGSVHPRIPHFVFLIGMVVRRPGEAAKYHSLVIDSEKAIPAKTREFLAFLDTLGDYQGYFWSKKELVEFAKIFDTYGISGSSVDRFLSRCCDLKDVFEGKVFFPVHGQSVKEIAKCLGYSWRELGVDAMEGMVLTYDYLENGNQQSLKKVQTYNEDDCLGMLTIRDWLAKNTS